MSDLPGMPSPTVKPEVGDWAVYSPHPSEVCFEVVEITGRMARVHCFNTKTKQRWMATIGVHALRVFRRKDGTRVYDGF